MDKLTALAGLRLAALSSKGYTAEQIAAVTKTLEGIFTDINNSLQAADEHIQSAHAPANAEENVIVSIKKNGAAIPPVSKIVDIPIPTKLSELENDGQFATTGDVTSAVNGSGHLKAVVVDELPAVSAATQNTIYYLRRSSGTAGELFDEYQLINGAFELIGASRPDLSGYATKTYVAKASNALIESIVSTAAASNESYIGAENLALFWSLIKPLISDSDVSELAARVRLLELLVFNEKIEGNPFFVTFESLDGINASGVWNVPSKRIEF